MRAICKLKVERGSAVKVVNRPADGRAVHIPGLMTSRAASDGHTRALSSFKVQGGKRMSEQRNQQRQQNQQGGQRDQQGGGGQKTGKQQQQPKRKPG
jgi:hypothetical protein